MPQKLVLGPGEPPLFLHALPLVFLALPLVLLALPLVILALLLASCYVFVKPMPMVLFALPLVILALLLARRLMSSLESFALRSRDDDAMVGNNVLALANKER